MLILLLQYHIKRLARYFKTRRLAKIITIALFFLVFAGIAIGVYLFFHEGFLYINHDPYLRQALTLYVYELFLLMVVFLVLFSSFITSLFGLFRGRNDSWILSSPNFRVWPYFVLTRVTINSVWPFFIIVLPALLAMRSVFGISLLGLLVALLSVLLLIILTIILVFISIMLLSKVLYHLRFYVGANALKFRWLIIAMMLLFILLVGFIWRYAINTDLIKLFQVHDLTRVSADTKLVSDQFRLFPTHLAASGIFALINHNFTVTIKESFKLLIITLGAGAMFTYTVSWFLPIWQKLQEGGFTAKTDIPQTRTKTILTFNFHGGPINTLFKKEALVLARDARGVLWFGFLLFVWLIQAGLNMVVGRNMIKYGLVPGAVPVMIQILQFVTAVYFISAFALRFAFPSFSSERRTAWILASAPLDFSKVFWAKLCFYVSVFTFMGLALSYINMSLLGLPLVVVGLSLVLFITAVLFITFLGLSLGALFPNFETDDPSVLSTSLPGLAFMAISLFYGALGAFILYLVLAQWSLAPVIAFEFLTVVAIIILARIAPRSLKNTDFIKTYS